MEGGLAAEFEVDPRGRIPLTVVRAARVLAAVDDGTGALVSDDRRSGSVDDGRQATGVVAVLVGYQDRRDVVETETGLVEARFELTYRVRQAHV